MKLYGKVDESWDDAKFQAMIEDALRMARAEKKVFAVGQNMDGTAVVALSKEDYPPIFACAATAFDDEAFQEDKIVLIDNVAYHEYSVDEMVPRVRGVLTRGLVEYGGLRFLSEGRVQLGYAMSCADSLVKLHKCPFIVGLTANGIMVAPFSERDRFLDVGIVRDNRERVLEHVRQAAGRWMPLHGQARAASRRRAGASFRQDPESR